MNFKSFIIFTDKGLTVDERKGRKIKSCWNVDELEKCYCFACKKIFSYMYNSENAQEIPFADGRKENGI